LTNDLPFPNKKKPLQGFNFATAFLALATDDAGEWTDHKNPTTFVVGLVAHSVCTRKPSGADVQWLCTGQTTIGLQ